MSAVVDAARALVGAPWRHRGRSAAGVDCLGLALLAYRAAGHDLPEPPPYQRVPQEHRLLAAISELGAARLAPDQARPGDLLVFRMGMYAGHVGILSEHPILRCPACIHAYLPRRRVVEEPLGLELQPHLIAAFRMDAR